MKIVAISDVHGRQNKITIPECDILISCGDYSFRGEHHMVRDYHKWLDKQPAKHIISVQGNHEVMVQRDFQLMKAAAVEMCPRVHFVEEGLVEVEGIRIWCSAWTPFFHDWAYNAFRGPDIQAHWDLIPNDIQILVTHGPPAGVLDETIRANGDPTGEHVGCEDLAEAIRRVKPDLHFFGHIHCGHGQLHRDGVSYYNVSICDEMYVASNPVTIVEYSKE